MSIQAQHFYWRAGFGPTANMLFQPASFSPSAYFEAFWEASQKLPDPLRASKNAIDGLSNGLGNLGQLQNSSEEDRRQMRQQMMRQSREEIRSLNLMWLEEMVNSPGQLREKMAFFWHGHFACRNLNSFYQQQLLQVIREGALGNFGDLLRSVSKSAAMLAFLNNQQNRKQSPNENFAREVMELFTMGRGHYTENDIKEAARAFTGWGFNLNGEFIFRKQFHDTGSKTVLGHTGQFDGDDVVNILLEQPATARFIVRKLYKFMVNEIPDDEKINWLAKRFFEHGFELKPLLADILTSTWFYDQQHIGSRIKSPIELWVGIRRLLPMDLENEQIQLLLQRALGQILFYPPSVAGWPGGTNWIDSSSLMLRMRLPHLVALAEPFNLHAKSDDDLNMGNMQGMDAQNVPQRFRLKADIGWEALVSAFDKIPQKDLPASIPRTLLLTHNIPLLPGDALPLASSDRNSVIQQTALAAMTSPEYQLC